MTLYLIRHAHAGEGNHEDPDDHLRPLSRKGQKQAEILSETLSNLDIRFHRLFSSPYTRAAETAAPLTPHVRGGRLELLSELTEGDYPGLVSALQGTLGKRDTTIALVGHEPYLERFDELSTLWRRRPSCRKPGQGALSQGDDSAA